MVKTKIICTIGPASESYEMLKKLYEAGMNIVRLNMSHGNHEWHEKIIKQIKTLNREVKHTIPILMDTQGPEIRTGSIDNDLNIKTGEVITITVRGSADVEYSSLHIEYEDLLNDVNVGDKITVDNGLINLEVLEKHDITMTCKVIDGGVLKSKRHVNLPGIKVNLPAITEKDKKDIQFAIDNDLDFIALSFVRQAEDIRELKKLMGDKVGKIKIIAKIEDQEGITNLLEIVKEADGVMVARGDLGVEINIEDLPNVQREIIRLCSIHGRRSIVATHMLESMIENPIPTRAEVTDVANAIYEEADAVMLSAETTVGKYPVKCVQQLVKIAQKAEVMSGLMFAKNLIKESDKQYLVSSAVQLAEELKASGIIVITRRGIMADYVSNCRPFYNKIYAFTNVNKTRRALMLNRGVTPYMIQMSTDPEKTLQNAFQTLRDREGFVSGDKVVVITDVFAKKGTIDAIQIRYIPEVEDSSSVK
ncbi:MAG: pyruvate kinase [Nitrospinae bacterium]|nr:pyruvate kinase [Nitrospinota bacterium]